MSLIKVASLKPNLQNKIRPLMKQARSGNFKSGKDALEYYIMGALLKREGSDMKGFFSLQDVLKSEKLSDVVFEEITLVSWEYAQDRSRFLNDQGQYVLQIGDGSTGFNCVIRLSISGSMKKDYSFTSNAKKTLEFDWKPRSLFAFLPPATLNVMKADGYKNVIIHQR